MRKVPLLFFTLLCSMALLAQQTITGKIADVNGFPIAGVTVKSLKTGKIALSGADGTFSLQLASDEDLEISSVGFIKQVVKAGTNPVNITLTQSIEELGQVVLVGSRRAGRVKTETTAPVDVINAAQVMAPTARMDLTAVLNYTAPSFNYNKQSGSDGADHIDLASLRGLGPDQTLVLVNGKRRHQTAFIAMFGTRGRGNTGTDLNAIPAGAIDRVEILRDGASAQYGSDAIAGVINIVTKKGMNQVSGSMGISAYYDPKFNTAFESSLHKDYEHDGKFDGKAFNGNINFGLPLGKKGGFINLTFDGTKTTKTFRQALKTDNYLQDDDAMYLNIYRRGHGDGELEAFGSFANLEVPVSAKTSIYAFGGTNSKSSDAYAFTRNWSARPDRFPTNSTGDLIFVSNIMRTGSDGEIWYSPHIQTKIKDFSATGGLKGVVFNNWNWDLSNTTGRNDFHFYGDKTFNASMGASQQHFDDGGFSFLQNTSNLNFSREFIKNFNLGVGLEYRWEEYEIYAGEEASYKNYSSGDKASGSQGFPGYQPNDEVTARRNVFGAYADAEFDVLPSWLMSLAARLENYSDFGFTHNYKFGTRIKASKTVNLRGSFSTGFRAPSLQQINFSSTFTTVQAGNIAEVKIAPNYSNLAKAAGIPDLTQEKSLSGSAGFTWKASPNLNITVDGYLTTIKDRVVLSGQFDGSDPNLDPSLRSIMNGLSVSLAQFFANAVNTTNAGVDVVAEYTKKWNTTNRFKALFAGNLQTMKINSIHVPDKLNGSSFLQQTFLSDREQKFILASAPGMKAALNLEYGKNKLTLGTRFTYFGKVTLLGYGQDGLGISPTVPLDNGNGDVPDQYDYSGKLVTDIYASHPLSKSFTLYAGIDNLLNAHPDFGVVKGAKDWAYNTETGGAWDAVQMGSNGRRLFIRIGFNF